MSVLIVVDDVFNLLNSILKVYNLAQVSNCMLWIKIVLLPIKNLA